MLRICNALVLNKIMKFIELFYTVESKNYSLVSDKYRNKGRQNQAQKH